MKNRQRGGAGALTLNESPYEKVGKLLYVLVKPRRSKTLNESPYEKVGKSPEYYSLCIQAIKALNESPYEKVGKSPDTQRCPTPF